VKGKKPAAETRAFEEAFAGQPEAELYVLRLFVTGTSPRAVLAIRNVRALCEEKLSGRHDIEVIDIYRHPELARPDQIVVAPTLVRKLPLPVRRLIGDLAQTKRVLVGLDLVASPEKPPGADSGS